MDETAKFQTETPDLDVSKIFDEKQNTLQEIKHILQRIEKLLTAEKQEEIICNAVSHAMMGNKYENTIKDV